MILGKFCVFNESTDSLDTEGYDTIQSAVEALDTIIQDNNWDPEDELYVIQVSASITPVNPADRWIIKTRDD